MKTCFAKAEWKAQVEAEESLRHFANEPVGKLIAAQAILSTEKYPNGVLYKRAAGEIHYTGAIHEPRSETKDPQTSYQMLRLG